MKNFKLFITALALLMFPCLAYGQYYLSLFPNSEFYNSNSIYSARSIAVDAHGNVYVADSSWTPQVVKLTPSGGYSVIAGGYDYATFFSGDGGPATAAGLGPIGGMDFDRKGNLYITDYPNYRIRKVDTNGIITTFAGCTGSVAYADGVPATNAFLNIPVAVACDKWGNVYIAQSGDERIRKVDTNGIIHTIAGTGIMGYSGDGGPATNADLHIGIGLAVDTLGNVYITGGNARKIGADGVISSIVGTGVIGYSGDGGPATSAAINTGFLQDQLEVYTGYYQDGYGSPGYLPGGIAVDRNGSLFLGCSNNGVIPIFASTDTSARGLIRRIATDGVITTIAGGGNNQPKLDSGLLGVTDIQYISAAASVKMGIYGDVKTDASGNIYYLDKYTFRIYKLMADTTAPQFFYGNNPFVTICENSGAYNLDSITSVYDGAGLSEHWAVAAVPLHGTLVCAYTAASTGGLLIPTGISYTPNSGFFGVDSMVVSVNNGVSTAYTTLRFLVKPLMVAGNILGDSILCQGSLTPAKFVETLPTLDGIWSSVPESLIVATAGDTMYLSPVLPGPVVVAFTNGCGTATMIVTVNAYSGISGPNTVCVGSSISLTTTDTGGIWSDHGAHASIGSGGLVTGISNGRDSVEYAMPGGHCTYSWPITVGLPDTFLHDSAFCAGAGLTIYPAPVGLWANSNPSVVNFYFDSVSAHFSFLTAGVSTITFTNTCGSVSMPVTVNPIPNDTFAIPGTLCTGGTYALSNSTPGGIWSTTGSNIEIDSSGHLHVLFCGLNDGRVYYSLPGGCAASANVFVYSSSASIIADSTVCLGSAYGVTINDSTNHADYYWYYYYTFGCSSPAVTWTSLYFYAPTFSIHNLATGVVTFTYNNGCAEATKTITVLPLPSLPSVAPVICSGGTITATDATPGGTWATSFGNLDISSTGVITTVRGATDEILYTLPTGCYNSVPVHITTVSPAPILGNETFCLGEHLNLVDSTPGGVWSTSDPAIVSPLLVATGAGTATISYYNGCGTVTKTVTVYPDPAPIGGPDSVCMGSTTAYTDTSSGGVWSVTGSGSISSSGIYTPAATGWDIIYYTLPTGCVYGQVVQVNPGGPTISITPETYFCGLGTHTGIADSIFEGTWTSSNYTIASPIVSAGNVSIYSSSPGQATLTYNVTNACGSFTTYKPVTVYPAPGNTFFSYSLCPGNTVLEYEADSTGLWHVDNSVAALTVNGNLTATIVGVSPGADTITYTDSNVCGASVLYYIENVPPLTVAAPIVGDSIVCVGSTTTYTDASPFGDWYGGGAPGWVDWLGIFHASSVGVTYINYVIYGLCSSATATKAITVYPATETITDSIGICEGFDTLIYCILPVGTWSDSNTHALITHVSDTGATVEAMTPTRDTVTYQISSFCGVANYQHILLIDTYLPIIPISGDSVICSGSTTSLSDDPLSGTWSSTVPAIATIDAGGNVFGVSAGTTLISYSASNACSTVTETKSLTVYPATSSTIVDSANMCLTSTRFISAPTTGGSWTTFSGDVSIVSFSSAGAIISADAAGTDTVYYSITTPCGVAVYKHIVHVSGAVTLGAISGSTTICLGSSVTLSETITGGLWSSSDTAVAVISSSGVVTGSTAGASLIDYTFSGSCDTVTAYLSITVDPVPSSPSIDSINLCVSTSHVFPAPVTGGTWSTAFGLVTIVAGTTSATVSGPVAGTDTVFYTISSICGSAIYKHVVHVIPAVTVAPVFGSLYVCAGSTTILSDPTAGGLWSASSGYLTVSPGGIVTGVLAGIDLVTYTVGNECGFATATATVTVYPDGYSSIDSQNICLESMFTYSGYPSGGVWAISNANAAFVTLGSGSREIVGVSSGRDSVTYTVSTICGFIDQIHIVKVISNAPLPPIIGDSLICAGTTELWSNSTPGGFWGSYSPTVASVTWYGAVTGVNAGTALIYYTVYGPCGAETATKTISVAVSGVLASYDTAICIASTFALAGIPAGGVWSVANGDLSFTTSGGTISATGILPGTDTLTYTTPSGCISEYTHVVHIVADTSVAPISGASLLCLGDSTLFTDSSPDGLWASTSPLVATITSSGLVTGLSNGTTLISYQITNVCGAYTATKTLTVGVVASAIVSGIDTFCAGSTAVYTATGAVGVWSLASGYAVGVTDTFGSYHVTGVTPGPDSVIYTVAGGCGPFVSFKPFYIAPLPIVGMIVGPDTLCAGSTGTMAASIFGGSWSMTNGHISIDSSGTITYVSSGTDTVQYTTTAYCGSNTSTFRVFATTNPGIASIFGPDSVCTGSNITLIDSTPGGVWVNLNPAANLTPSSDYTLLTGISSGTDSVLYVVHFYCGVDTASATITILPTPVSTPISGPDSVCIGASIALADAYPGGTWSVSNSRVSCSAGLLTGNSRGIDTVFYSYANSCGSFTVNQHVTILDIPSTGSITGPMGLCIGTTATFVDSVSGGAWATTDPSVTITDGIAGVSKAGIDTVFYVVSNMCGADTARKVFTADTAVHGTISGKSYVCVGKTDTLTLTPSGGLLIFANADADLFAGTYAQGVSPGKDTITYSFMNYCGTDTSVYTFDVYSDWKCDSINLVPNVTDKKGGQLHIFPNPGSGLYEVSLDQTGNQISVVITDLLGRTVLTAQHSDIDHFDLDIQSEASGAYFITVVVDGVTYNGKLIRW